MGVKRPEREAHHSPPYSAEVKELVERYLHSPNMPSWGGAQVKKRIIVPLVSKELNFIASAGVDGLDRDPQLVE